MKHYQNAIIDGNGNAVNGASIYVYDVGTVNEATIYSDEGVTPVAQPLTADSMGRFNFYVADGDYDIKISGTGIATFTLQDVTIVDGKDRIKKDGTVAFTADQPMGTKKLTGLGVGGAVGNSVRYEQAILVDGTNAFTANQPMGGKKLTGLAAGSANGDSIRYDEYTADKTDVQVFLPIKDFVFNVGTWAETRNAASNYSMNHSAADETSYVSADITEIMRTAANKGLKLTSFDVIYSIGTEALDAHSVALNKVTYANNAAVVVASFGGSLSGSLATAIQANPYLSTITMGTPVYPNTADMKVNIELTVNHAATTVYKLYGIMLNFSYNLV